MCIYMCVCINSLLLFWQKKHHKVLHEMKMDSSRTLSNLEKFRFSRKIRIWELHSPRSVWSGNNGNGQITQAGSTRICSAGLNSPLPWRRQHGLVPKILQHPQHSGGFQPTLPSTPCLGTAWEALWDRISPVTIWAIPKNGVGEATPDERLCLTLLSVELPQSLCQFQHIF